MEKSLAYICHRVIVVLSAILLGITTHAEGGSFPAEIDLSTLIRGGTVLVLNGIDPGDLTGHTVGVEWGGPGDALVRPWEEAGRIAAREPFLSPQEALEALEAGQVDAAVVDRISAITFGGEEQLLVLDPPLEDESFVAVTAHRAVWLQRQLDRALSQLAEDGTLAALEEKWCREEPEEGSY